MPVFQVSSRIMRPPGPPKKRISHVRKPWYAIIQVVCGVLIVGVLTFLSRTAGLSFWFFLLLPVGVSIITAYSHLYNLKVLLLTACLALIYFGGITGLQLLIHSPGTPEIIVVTTTLTMAVLFEPVRTRVQSFMEQRFHLRDDEAIKAIEVFISTLREVIDLDQVREQFLDVVQRTMQPQSVSVWVRTTIQDETGSPPRHPRWGKHDRQVQREGRTQERQKSPVESFSSTVPVDVTVADKDPLMAYALRHPGAVEVDRLNLDSPVLQTLKTNGVAIVLPLVSQGELISLLTLGLRLDGQEYTRQDRSLLTTLAAHVAPALHVTHMVQVQQAQVREHERIEQELRTAQEIQHTFLPKDVPPLPGWQLKSYYQPAREVGGDFYDFLPSADGRLGLVIGDVTDKGIPAALVMTATRTMLRTAAQETASPGEVLARVNDLLCAEIPPGMFVTCFYALLEPKSGRLRYANAGQDLPYRRHDDGVSALWATGMPLGLMPGTRYEEHEVIVVPGESLLFYSDGLVEAHNSRREMFDTPRLKAVLEEQVDGASLIDVLLGELTRFTGQGWEQEDDLTMVLLQRARTAGESAGNEREDGWSTLGEWRIPSVPGNERKAMELVTEVLRPLGLPAQRMASLETAVAEAVMNAMEHGNEYRLDTPVILQVRAKLPTLIVRIRDEGSQRPIPAAGRVASPDLEAKLAGRQSPRGWGLFLIRNLVDEVHISGDDHHVVELVMHLEMPGTAK